MCATLIKVFLDWLGLAITGGLDSLLCGHSLPADYFPTACPAPEPSLVWVGLYAVKNVLSLKTFRLKSKNIDRNLLYLISSNISGFSRSLCFIRSFIAVMIVFALSSAPCFELFSAAPGEKKKPCLLSLLCNTRGGGSA